MKIECELNIELKNSISYKRQGLLKSTGIGPRITLMYTKQASWVKKVHPNIQGHNQVENLSVWNLYENQKS